MIALDKIIDIGYSIEKNISIDCFFTKPKKMPRKMKKDFKKLYGFKKINVMEFWEWLAEN